MPFYPMAFDDGRRLLNKALPDIRRNASAGILSFQTP
jgi:hypothetical protein